MDQKNDHFGSNAFSKYGPCLALELVVDVFATPEGSAKANIQQNEEVEIFTK